MLRSSSKLFWNGVSDRIIRFLVRTSAKTFQIAIFGRLLLKFVPKSELSYLGLRPKTIFGELRNITRLLLPSNDEDMIFLNPLAT